MTVKIRSSKKKKTNFRATESLCSFSDLSTPPYGPWLTGGGGEMSFPYSHRRRWKAAAEDLMLFKLRRRGFRLETKAKVWSTSLETVVIVEKSVLVREKQSRRAQTPFMWRWHNHLLPPTYSQHLRSLLTAPSFAPPLPSFSILLTTPAQTLCHTGIMLLCVKWPISFYIHEVVTFQKLDSQIANHIRLFKISQLNHWWGVNAKSAYFIRRQQSLWNGCCWASAFQSSNSILVYI